MIYCCYLDPSPRTALQATEEAAEAKNVIVVDDRCLAKSGGRLELFWGSCNIIYIHNYIYVYIYTYVSMYLSIYLYIDRDILIRIR